MYICRLQLFKVSQLEDAELTDELSNHMGLFLQKTNIIRDYLEDINEEPAPRQATYRCTDPTDFSCGKGKWHNASKGRCACRPACRHCMSCCHAEQDVLAKANLEPICTQPGAIQAARQVSRCCALP